jgi:DNA-binding MarR family transcriptional regulator
MTSTGAELLDSTLALARRIRLLLEEDGLKIRQFTALRALAGAPMRVGELAQEVEVRTPSAVALVDGLAERGLVRRAQDADDGRVSLVELTPAGRRAVRRAERRLIEVFDALAAGTELAAR